MTDSARALDAIGTPARRRILELVAPHERSVRELTDELDMTQSAVSQHLKVLRDAGLVAVRAEGTRRLYRVDLDQLAQVRAWVDGFWDDVLAAFAQHVTDTSTEEHR
ncbi:ArsR/SmtB family transcription factor [Nocardioides bruguierae]|uniref:ArsR/SmtB family transcription factor n=1 Tax=Nocardioides bruguierae TaxID=2945102 RepID=UPI002021A427|nr:metalloregulator ArsR/SmtB family transcription factor [Nocardioides bruguierae]MCL8023769.1 metalloregulator ArsR/SmtB family transcription factor [Nocardioides bruguierae]